jgi:lipid-A-disaccharide synthase
MLSSDNNKKIIFLSAGEHSGDSHTSQLIKELKQQLPEFNYKFTGLGGDEMISQGLNPLYHIKDLAVVGITDVLKKYFFFRKVLNNSADIIKQTNPECVILTDYPGFNLRLAEKIRKFYNGKIIYYISPQLWAWNEKRIFKIKKNIDLMLTVFPFENDLYNKYGIKSIYCGHPLTKKIKDFLKNQPSDKDKSTDIKIVTLLPGSRENEIKTHLPVLINAADIIKKQYDIEVHISCASGMKPIFNEFANILKTYNVTENNIYELIYKSDAVLTKAGTSSLECSLIGTPNLVFYKTNYLNYHLLRPMVKVKYLGLTNILLNKQAVKEFIQNDFNAENIANETIKLIFDNSYRENMKKELAELWNLLGVYNTSEIAAKEIINHAGLK